jgi:hypothetical protein
VVDGFYVNGLWAALLGSLIISVTNIVLSTLLKVKKVKAGRGPTEPPAPTPPPGKGDVIDV